ncbi:LamG-like jellyroll fold domain-containing protein [Naasia lichenicola]|uniref:PKD domain-containing protein n=1 Tax=Naasia lichenicola TaxID=2565933 RepID=A0A4S4FKW0_9MICO|nr:LamG-like jellyroll fold domain-containing protein [Naasia lichenicola]THG30798.1 PKD domain-containing protein [Naasia lichenicola]
MPLALTTRLRAVAVSAVLLTTAGLLTAMPAQADTSPVSGTPETVSTDPLPTVQIDGIVWSQVIVGNTVYVGGQFANARPAGNAVGVGNIARSNLLAYNLSTGVLIASFAPTLNGQVNSLSASPDGTRLYVGGTFTTVNGVTRNRVAAFTVATGALVTSWAPSFNSAVDVVKATNSTVYVGGNFTAVGGTSRTRAASVSATTGAVTTFAPVAEGGRVRGIAVSPDATKVVLAGSFTTLNSSGNPGYGMGEVTATTGSSLAWAVNTKVRNAGANSAIYSLTSDDTAVYGTGYTFGTGGNLEGAFRAEWSTGALTWADSCLGDTYSLALTSSIAYVAGHHHDCSTEGGFPQTSPDWSYQRGMAYAKVGAGAVSTGTKWAGVAAPTALNWWPDFNTGTVSGQGQGPWSVAANEQYVVYGGEFTKVNNGAQQGLVRFAVKSIAPNDDGPRLSGSSYLPTAVSYASGTVKVNWRANYDRDNELLTYELLRDGNTTTPIYTTTASSKNWYLRPNLTFTDTGLTAGSTHTYKVRVTDPFGNVATGNSVSVTAAASGSLSSYATTILNDSPTSYWRLGESTTTVADLAGTNNAVATSTVTRSQAGALANDTDTAARFSGSSSSYVSTQTAVLPPNTVSVEAWFKTTASTRGKIVGFGNVASGSSTNNYDRDITIDSSGRLSFGVRSGTATVSVSSSASGYNNGAWHHAVATVGSAGIKLYVDGVQVASRTDATAAWWTYPGYWRIGGDTASAGSSYFNGTVDDVAVYSSALTAAQVSSHYTAGKTGTGTTSNAAPTASFTSSATGLALSVDGSASRDADGTIASYAWSFGDGSTATGATASHTYASAGAYTVILTAKDDKGATGTSTRSISVSTTTTPPATGTVANDDFTRTVSGGLGAAVIGGAWTNSSSTSTVYSVDGASGRLSTAAAGKTYESYLTGATSSSVDVTSTVAFSAVPVGGSAFASVIARRVGTVDYRARAVVAAGGAVSLQLQASGSTLTSVAVSGLSYAVGDRLQVRVQATGTSPTTLRAKVWKVGSTEPAAWQLTTTDATAALQGTGYLGLGSYVGSAVTTLPVTVSFDDYLATTVQ